MVGWPHKLETQLEQVGESLDKDEERFHKNLLNDQTVFEDRLDELEVREQEVYEKEKISEQNTASCQPSGVKIPWQQASSC